MPGMERILLPSPPDQYRSPMRQVVALALPDVVAFDLDCRHHLPRPADAPTRRRADAPTPSSHKLHPPPGTMRRTLDGRS
jgi:hypothetical protein